ncbi:MAG TPA: N-acetylglucosamine/diacetylchitobiose ABC transporter substrate-binding protein [Jiangellaceae bacterium]|nr:N-acetylglucosamine/diacetylchitobiose ABC transporter substrate-binding protein [Jiangellaceae bacterium]
MSSSINPTPTGSLTSPTTRPTRRRFLQQMAVTGLVFGSGGVLTSCATAGGGDDGGDDGANEGEVSEDNPLGVPAEAPLEVYIFNGGFTDAYATETHQPMYAETYPDAEIDHSATEDIGGELQSRFVAGDPPDVVNNSGDGQIDPGQLVSSEQVMDLTELFDAPSWDDPEVPVRDTLLPGTVESGTFGDAPYQLNYAFTVYGLWYDQALFDEHGWTAPTTWDEMLELCAEIQSAGIAPWTYQGQHPRYMSWPLLTMAAKLGGSEVITAIDNLEEGAWGHDAVREAAAALASLNEQGYILEGTAGMDHVQAQTAWCEGQAAFVPCGSWLESEQADVIPEGFQMTFLAEPMLSADGAMSPETIRAAPGEPFVVPADANNPQGGLEYLRIMLSQDGARGFTEQTSSLTAVAGAADDVELPPGLASAQAGLDAAGDDVVNWLYPTWYRSLENPAIDTMMGDLLTNRISVDEWVEGCEAEAAAVRDDDSVTKYTR